MALLITQEPLSGKEDHGGWLRRIKYRAGGTWVDWASWGSRARGRGGNTSLHDVILNLLDLEVPEDAISEDGEQRGAC